ncbi:hypothetical protein SEA_SCHMIDT_39 [Gordonia phage Schmidt]|uniref:Uncharacterized protein n=1 Tax=Gordonia phage Schmidt TaxID=2301697 RepID=A0A385E089_9CAUD|nr:hypothetical protein KDJ59_gp39 [Gordonia phage Schmidt]AXQ65161.1 hypothetical protein SEA_SCHMIDT_39 [Gordonia phage Schmidt]
MKARNERRAERLLRAGRVDEYAGMIGHAVAVRRRDGNEEGAQRLLAAEADRWLGDEGKLPRELAEPIGLARELAAVE